MTKDEFRETLKSLELTQAELARLLKVRPLTVNRYAQGHSPVPYTIELILQLLLNPNIPEKLLEKK